jgi:hypothetical protein
MALYDRLVANDTNTKISIHTFMSVVSEVVRGQMTIAEVQTALNIPANDPDWTALQTKVNGINTVANRLLFLHELEQVLIVGEAGIKYTTVAAAKTRLA